MFGVCYQITVKVQIVFLLFLYYIIITVCYYIIITRHDRDEGRGPPRVLHPTKLEPE